MRYAKDRPTVAAMPDPTTKPKTSPGTHIPTPPETAPAGPRVVLPFAPGLPVPGLNSWVLERKLGTGGFGEVWLVRHEWNDARRALKFCTDPATRERLVTHEKQAVVRAMRLTNNHPNIVPLLECSLDGPYPWLMYEYVEGGTLADAIERWKARSVRTRFGKAVRALHAVAAALAVCHKHDPPLVHRDIKPHNILMAGKVPRITDFGLSGTVAVAQGDGLRLPTVLVAMGTMCYAPPEQLFGSAPDPRDDVYALGITAYQLLLGDLQAIPGTDAPDILAAAQVPADLASLVVKSVSMDPLRRPAHAGKWLPVLEYLLKRTELLKAQNSDPSSVVKKLDVLVAEAAKVLPVSVPGTWYRRARAGTAGWEKVTTTPAQLTAYPGEEYCLTVARDATDERLAGLADLARVPALTRLALTDCAKVTDAGLARLRGLVSLTWLSLMGCEAITDAGLAVLPGLPELRSLDLQFCKQTTDVGLAHVSRLAKLEVLSLEWCGNVTDAGLLALRGLKRLKALKLAGCKKVTAAGVAAVQAALPNCKVAR